MISVSRISIGLFLTIFWGFSLFGQNQKFDIYLYFGKDSTNYEISKEVEPSSDETIIFRIHKQVPVESYEYSFQRIFSGKLSRVKKQAWENKKGVTSISLIFIEKQSTIKEIERSKLTHLNVIDMNEIDKAKFNSLIKVLKKANNLYAVVEKWDNVNDKNLIRCYPLKLL